jgi:outer membrane protein TolC
MPPGSAYALHEPAREVAHHEARPQDLAAATDPACIALAGCALRTAQPAAGAAIQCQLCGRSRRPAATVEANGSAQHFDTGAPSVPQWWQLYGSDTLNSWVDEGLNNNASLDALRHTLEAVHQQFRAQVGETVLPSIDAGGQVSRAARARNFQISVRRPISTMYSPAS